MNPEQKLQKCFNCGFTIDSKSNFCSNCGQKNTDGKVGIADLVKEFFSEQLSIDSKLFQTIFALFIPNKLTREYFKGKHKTYINPLRLFLFLAIFTLGLSLAYLPETSALKTSDSKVFNGNFIKERELLVSLIDSVEALKVQNSKDTSATELLDTLKEMFLKDRKFLLQDSISMDIFSFQLTDDEGSALKEDSIDIMVAIDDLLSMPANEIFQTYKISGFVKRLAFNQLRKTILDNSSFNNYLLSNIPWILLFMMPVLALILKLLYLRRNVFYIEHLILSFHVHSFLFLLAIIGLLLFRWAALIPPPGLAGAIVIGYVFICIKRYYEQSFLKSLLKTFIIIMAYLILTALFLIFGSAISILMF